MIVPAAGAVMAIIEGLQAAWGTVSRIIAAFGAFVAFLKAIKGGGAGPQFATLLAAAAVVVLDFVSSWLLRKLANAARKVGAKLEGLAQKFMKRRKARKGPKRKPEKKPDGKGKEDKEETLAEKEARLRAAVEEVHALFRGRRRVKPLLRLSMARIKRKHRLSQLRAQRTGAGKTSRYEITAIINPMLVFEETAASDDAATLSRELRGHCEGLTDSSQKNMAGAAQQRLQRLFPGAGYRLTWNHLSASDWSVTMHDAQGQSFSVGVLQKLKNDGEPVAQTGPKSLPTNSREAVFGTLAAF